MRADLESRAELGRKLAPYRDALPGALAVLCLVAADPSVTTATVGTILVAVALAFLIFVEASGAGQETPEPGRMPVRGPFAVVRHPRILAQALVVLSLCVYSGSLKVLILGGVVSGFAFYFLTALDDMELAQRLGTTYDEYADQVPEILPKGWPRSELWDLDVPWQLGLSRALPWLGFAGLALLFMMFRA